MNRHCSNAKLIEISVFEITIESNYNDKIAYFKRQK